MNIARRLILGGIAAMSVASTATAQTNEDIDNPGRLLASNCYQCHGTDGQGARGGFEGLEPGEIVEELNDMARESRVRGAEGIMIIHAQAYSAQEITLIADYLTQICGSGSCENEDEDEDEGEDREAQNPQQVALHVYGRRFGDITSDVPALSCENRCREISERLPVGTEVTLTAVPLPTRIFSGWSGDCHGTDLTCSFTVTREFEVAARFAYR